MSKINFQPVFEYIDKTKIDLKTELIDEIVAEFHSRFDGVTNLIDSLSKDVKDYHDESRIMSYRIERLEDWGKKASKKIQTPINF